MPPFPTKAVGYFGGSFDPPHLGHLHVALAAKERFALDELLLAPTGRQPLKPEGPSASFHDRLAMTERLCVGHPGLRASGIDAPHADGTPNYTADTLQQLSARLPAGTRLFAIVGADAFLGLPKWRDADRLFTLADWIVVSRPGIPPGQIHAMSLAVPHRDRIHILGTLADPTSATDLRARLRAAKACNTLLPEAVCEYIRAHGLYLA